MIVYFFIPIRYIYIVYIQYTVYDRIFRNTKCFKPWGYAMHKETWDGSNPNKSDAT